MNINLLKNKIIKNEVQDTYLAHTLVNESKYLLSGGWVTRHDVEGEFGLETENTITSIEQTR